MIFLLIAVVMGYTEEELDKGRACSKITIDLFVNDFQIIKEVLDAKQHLESKNLENKIFADLLDQCVKDTPMSVLEPIKYVFGNYSWKDFKNYIAILPDKYNEEADLIISPEHYKFRKAVLASEGGPKYIGDPKFKDQTLKDMEKKIKEEAEKRRQASPNAKPKMPEDTESIKKLRQRMNSPGAPKTQDL